MGRSEWVLLLSDKDLKRYFELAQEFEYTGAIPNEAREIIRTEYNQFSYLERGISFCIDIYKEAAHRWVKVAN